MKYIDRSGNVTEVDSGQDRLLRWLYTHMAGRLLLKPLVQPAVSKAGGFILSHKLSRCLIGPFVKHNKIDLSCYEEQDYQSYNSFFTRKIRPECRPAEGDKYTLIAPCDGKLSVQRIGPDCRFFIKNTPYTLPSLLRSQKLAKHYANGYACIFRLTVDDYHRYCYMDDGKKSRNYRIDGVFHTVNPVANDIRPIYKENTREFTLLKSRHFKTILIMEVGALLVGKITNYDEACEVKKGSEKGCFEFGGSTIVILLQDGAVQLEDRLIANTEKGYETVVKMGECIGRTVFIHDNVFDPQLYSG